MHQLMADDRPIQGRDSARMAASDLRDISRTISMLSHNVKNELC